MAGVMNKSARQYNLRGCRNEIKNGVKVQTRTTIRIAPGFNIVPDDVWEQFVPKKGKGKKNEYVENLEKEGMLSFGPDIDDLEMEQAGDTDCKTKVVSNPVGDETKV